MPFDYPEAGASVPASGVTTKGEAMSLKPYKVTINDFETTLLLSDADARAQGLLRETPAEKAAPAKKAATPANKARKATANKAK